MLLSRDATKRPFTVHHVLCLPNVFYRLQLLTQENSEIEVVKVCALRCFIKLLIRLKIIDIYTRNLVSIFVQDPISIIPDDYELREELQDLIDIETFEQLGPLPLAEMFQSGLVKFNPKYKIDEIVNQEGIYMG